MLKNQYEVLAWSQNHHSEAKLTIVLSTVSLNIANVAKKLRKLL